MENFRWYPFVKWATHLKFSTCVALFLCLQTQLCKANKEKGRRKIYLRSGKKMSFSKMLEILQEKNGARIVLIKLGHFYIATGKDAVLLHNKFGLKCTCFKNNICKVGVPVTAIDKYIEKLDKTTYSYVVYDYIKEKKELKEIINRPGRACRLKNKNINCLKCKGIAAYEDDEYVLALNKFFDGNL